MELAHQHLVHKLNCRDETERENARMTEMERAATPFFYAVFGIAAAVVLWLATADYRDVAQYRLDTIADRQQYERISTTLASCANGDTVVFDHRRMTCRFKEAK